MGYKEILGYLAVHYMFQDLRQKTTILDLMHSVQPEKHGLFVICWFMENDLQTEIVLGILVEFMAPSIVIYHFSILLKALV